jgi:hypothetical protein
VPGKSRLVGGRRKPIDGASGDSELIEGQVALRHHLQSVWVNCEEPCIKGSVMRRTQRDAVSWVVRSSILNWDHMRSIYEGAHTELAHRTRRAGSLLHFEGESGISFSGHDLESLLRLPIEGYELPFDQDPELLWGFPMELVAQYESDQERLVGIVKVLDNTEMNITEVAPLDHDEQRNPLATGVFGCLDFRRILPWRLGTWKVVDDPVGQQVVRVVTPCVQKPNCHARPVYGGGY